MLHTLNYGAKFIDSRLPKYANFRNIWDQALIHDFIRKLLRRRDWTAMLTGRQPTLIDDVGRTERPRNEESFTSRIRRQEQSCGLEIVPILIYNSKYTTIAFPGSPHSYVIAHVLQRSQYDLDQAQANGFRRWNFRDQQSKLITFWKEVFCIFPTRRSICTDIQ